MRLRCLVVALALLTAFASDSWGRSPQPSSGTDVPSKQTTQRPVADQRGTDQTPLSVKILPAPDAEKQAEKQERERQEKEFIDKKVAFETQRIADYTWWLASITGLLFVVAIIQAAFFFIQLGLMKKGMNDATKAAEAAQASAEIAKEQVALTKMGIIDLERAYLAGGPTNIRLRPIPQIDITQFPQVGMETVLHLVMHNTGRTGAVITKIYGEFSQTAPQGNTPLYSAGDSQQTDLSLPAGKESSLPVQFTDTFTGSQFFWGYVEYNDIFKNKRTTRFCTLIHPSGDAQPGKFEIVGEDGWRECD